MCQSRKAVDYTLFNLQPEIHKGRGWRACVAANILSLQVTLGVCKLKRGAVLTSEC